MGQRRSPAAWLLVSQFSPRLIGEMAESFASKATSMEFRVAVDLLQTFRLGLTLC